MEKVFCRYLREEPQKYDPEKKRGKPYGLVVVDQAGFYGVSLCNPKDTFRRDRARTIAFGRLRRRKGNVAQVASQVCASHKKRQLEAAKKILELWESMKKYLIKEGGETDERANASGE